MRELVKKMWKYALHEIMIRHPSSRLLAEQQNNCNFFYDNVSDIIILHLLCLNEEKSSITFADVGQPPPPPVPPPLRICSQFFRVICRDLLAISAIYFYVFLLFYYSICEILNWKYECNFVLLASSPIKIVQSAIKPNWYVIVEKFSILILLFHFYFTEYISFLLQMWL